MAIGRDAEQLQLDELWLQDLKLLLQQLFLTHHFPPLSSHTPKHTGIQMCFKDGVPYALVLISVGFWGLGFFNFVILFFLLVYALLAQYHTNSASPKPTRWPSRWGIKPNVTYITDPLNIDFYSSHGSV